MDIYDIITEFIEASIPHVHRSQPHTFQIHPDTFSLLLDAGMIDIIDIEGSSQKKIVLKDWDNIQVVINYQLPDGTVIC